MDMLYIDNFNHTLETGCVNLNNLIYNPTYILYLSKISQDKITTFIHNDSIDQCYLSLRWYYLISSFCAKCNNLWFWDPQCVNDFFMCDKCVKNKKVIVNHFKTNNNVVLLWQQETLVFSVLRRNNT